MSKIILCADDSVTMQKVAEITFRHTDYTYVGARSADEALDKARGDKPVLVLADAVMPGKTGYDLCQAIKGDGALADVPVVILCGNSAPYDAARGAQVGADATVTKPWDTQVMLDKVTEVLDKAAAHGVAGAGAAAASPPPAARPTAPTPTTLPGQPAPAIPTSITPAAAAAAAAKPQMPPRSATIMGMPTIKMPPGMPGTAPAVPLMTAPAVPTVPAVPKVPSLSPPAPRVPAVPPPPAPRAVPAPAPAPFAAAPAPAPAAAAPAAAVGRPSMIAGVPTKRSALVERTLAKMAARLAELAGIEPGSPELIALLKLSTEVVERIVWEVVPDLAETIIRENLRELTAKRAN
jgi:CheY-like chemotaxis protein